MLVICTFLKVSPVGERLAASRFGGLAAGLNLLSMALPGVPILRSGDELAAMSPDFTWTEGSLRDVSAVVILDQMYFF